MTENQRQNCAEMACMWQKFVSMSHMFAVFRYNSGEYGMAAYYQRTAAREHAIMSGFLYGAQQHDVVSNGD